MGRLVQHYDEIVGHYLAGETMAQIGESFEISYREVWRILKKKGVKLRPKFTYFPREEDELRVVEKYESGLSLSQIARDYDCHFATIRYALIKHGIQPRRRGATSRPFSKGERREIVEAYKGGQSQNTIGKRMGCSQGLISRVLLQEGISKRRRWARSTQWKGGVSHNADGRVFINIPDDSPYASMRSQTGYVAEHRLILAQSLGRPLSPTETVHHINGDVSDNRIGNLELRQGRHGRGIVLECADCGSRNIQPVNLAEG